MTIWLPVLDRSKPLYLAIADAIAHDVEGGTLAEGARLPPQRELAWKLGVTLGTITRAYREAGERGLLSGEVGRGSYVRRVREVLPLSRAGAEHNGMIDMSSAVPGAVVRPEEFDEALASVMRDPSRLSLLDYAPTDGLPQHKAMAVTWLKHSGITADEQDVVMTAGAHLGLSYVLETLREGNGRILAEEINYALLGHTFRNAGLEPVPLAMDADGLLPDALDKAAAATGAKILYLVPSLQNPTTNTMSRHRRDAIVALARKHDLTIIEDDIFRLLDPRTQPATFYALAPERTYHLSSFSKTLSPGLRIGFVAAPENQSRALKTHLRMAAARCASLTAEIVRYWIESDTALSILTRTRNELAARRAFFLEIFKDARHRCEPGAPFAWVEVPDHWQGNNFAAALSARNIRVSRGSAFNLQPYQKSRHIRICFGGAASHTVLRQGLESIRSLMSVPPTDDYTPVG